MKERYIVILQSFLTTRERVEIEADEIDVDSEGNIRLYDGERCIAYFCSQIALGVYRKAEIGAPKETHGKENENDVQES